MSRKVFISVLGTGIYEECIYRGKSGNTTRTRFVQEAVLNEIGARSWSEQDAVCVILTSSARVSNWNKTIHERNHILKGIVPYSGLEFILDEMRLPCLIESIDIPDGKDEKEIWDIFNIIYSLLKENDELYLDLTHAFRYLPMLLLVLSNYAKDLKNVRVVNMSYGNYEASIVDSVSGNRITPIVDLLPLAQLQDWTKSASVFKEIGRVEVLCNMLREIIRTNQGNKEICAQHMIRLNQNLEKFQFQIETCSGADICNGSAVHEIGRYISKVKEKMPAPIIPILDSIYSEIKCFRPNTIANISASIRWCQKYGLIQQGYTMLQEGIVTVICAQMEDLNPFKGDNNLREYRDYWSAILGIREAVALDARKWKPILMNHRELTYSFLELEWVKDLRNKYANLTGKRNAINHGGFTKGIDIKRVKQDFANTVESLLPFFEQTLDRPKLVSRKDDCRERIFINISNHPIKNWTERQLEAAKKYGELHEIEFPNINPDLQVDEFRKEVDSLYSKVQNLANGKIATVHIMGEMTFTFAIVSELKREGIRCVASTSSRNTIENEDRSKTSYFDFVGFRDYEYGFGNNVE